MVTEFITGHSGLRPIEMRHGKGWIGFEGAIKQCAGVIHLKHIQFCQPQVKLLKRLG
jgi:hypothetical protein